MLLERPRASLVQTPLVFPKRKIDPFDSPEVSSENSESGTWNSPSTGNGGRGKNQIQLSHNRNLSDSSEKVSPRLFENMRSPRSEEFDDKIIRSPRQFFKRSHHSPRDEDKGGKYFLNIEDNVNLSQSQGNTIQLKISNGDNIDLTKSEPSTIHKNGERDNVHINLFQKSPRRNLTRERTVDESAFERRSPRLSPRDSNDDRRFTITLSNSRIKKDLSDWGSTDFSKSEGDTSDITIQSLNSSTNNKTSPREDNKLGFKCVDGMVLVSKNFLVSLKGGTLEKLIERVTSEIMNETDEVDILLLTFRNYIDCDQFMGKVFDRYRQLFDIEMKTRKDTKVERLRVAKFLKRWISYQFHDFINEPNLAPILEELVNQTFNLNEHDIKVGESIMRSFVQKKNEYEHGDKENIMFSEYPPDSIITEGRSFFYCNELEFARQLCLFHQSNFIRKINPKEFLNQSWNKNKESAPHITQMIEFFNNLSNFVATTICNEDTYQVRGMFIVKFLNILMHCWENNNFDCVMSICAGLSYSSIYRMDISWHKVKDRKLLEKFEMVKEQLSSDGSYKNLRNLLKSINPPCIPYIGVYLTDLTFIEDGNPDYLIIEDDDRNDIINFDKMRKVASVIQDFCLYQLKPYNFHEVEPIQDLLKKIKLGEGIRSEEENYTLSRSLEPRELIEHYFEKKKAPSKIISESLKKLKI